MRVTTKGQVTIPLSVRKKLGIIPYSEVEFVEEKGRMYIVKTTSQARKSRTVTVQGKGYTVELQPDLEDGGYVVECPGLSGCMSQGDTIEEALDMIRDAIRGHLAVLRKEDQGKKRSRAA
jgi:AbrB family looped-hinge helix DNA binding protein